MSVTAEQRALIEQMVEETHPTRRATVPAMEALLYRPIPVLDHGFVRVIDYMGDDGAIVQAARVSYGRGTKRASDDAGLINYLMRNAHTSPFEMCELKIHVKMPIFVARQWIRHRMASLNEYSARYSILDREFYVPDAEYLKATEAKEKFVKKQSQGQSDLFGLTLDASVTATAEQSQTNKQGREGAISEDQAQEVLRLIAKEGERDFRTYHKLLNEDDHGRTLDPERAGIARELARMVLPLNTYTQMYWKIDLHNLLHFLRLRADSHAQYEIRAYAEALLDVVRKWVPLTAAAFDNHRAGATTLSAEAMATVRRMLAGETVTREDTRLSAREWRELMTALGREG